MQIDTAVNKQATCDFENHPPGSRKSNQGSTCDSQPTAECLLLYKSTRTARASSAGHRPSLFIGTAGAVAI